MKSSSFSTKIYCSLAYWILVVRKGPNSCERHPQNLNYHRGDRNGHLSPQILNNISPYCNILADWGKAELEKLHICGVWQRPKTSILWMGRVKKYEYKSNEAILKEIEKNMDFTLNMHV